MFAFIVDKASLNKTISVLEFELKANNPKVQKIASRNVFEMIQSSGNVPVDTGELKNYSFVRNDRIYKNDAIMGWPVPWAKKMYYGIHAEKDSVIIDGKRKTVLSHRNGIPFWDRPITRNSALMTRIYQTAINMVYKEK